MISFYNLTFKELIEGSHIPYEDPYNIASSLCPEMKEAILHNPSGYRADEVCQILALDDNIIVGCTNPFSGRLKMDGKTVAVQQGSYLYSHENYRKENVGGDLFMRIVLLHPTQNCFFSGISHMAMGLYKAMKCTIFEYPRMIYLKRCGSVVHALLKTESAIVNPVIFLGNLFFSLHRLLLKIYSKILYRNYKVEESDNVPQQVEDIIDSDRHAFGELHDRDWIEWNLKHKFTNEPRLKKLFLIKKNGSIEAFFITKEQFYRHASSRGFKNVNLGSLMEWGIDSQSSLKEKDIYLISLHCFSKNVDGIQYVTTDSKLVRTLRLFLFVGIGKANTGFRIRSFKDPRLNDIRNWRIRLAASDTLLN